MASGRQHASWQEIPPPPGGNPERLLVQRVLSSQCLEKSARMREFLAYVYERTLSDPQAEIREQEIGRAVFGRPTDYDTNQDNIVRVNASQLRRKLEAYFASEGSGEPLILQLPKGQYRPVFQARAEENGAALPVQNSARRWTVRLLACVSGVLALLCVGLSIALLYSRPPAESGDAAALHAFWSRLIQKNQATSIVLSDSSLGLTQDLTGQPVPLAEYIHPDIWRQAASLAPRPDAQMAARLAARRRHTDMAGVHVARRILATAGTDQGRISLYFARDFTLRQMKSDNVILLGSRRTNPWVEIVEERMRFRFGFTPATRQGFFENPWPLAGELPGYAADAGTSFCQITLLANPAGAGNRLVISGTDVEGTEAGGEFLTGAAAMAALRRRLPADRGGRFPDFEALLKCARIGGATPGCEIVAVRSTPTN